MSLSLRAIMSAAFGVLLSCHAAASGWAQVVSGGPLVDSSRTVNTPLTGRVMRCQDGKILVFGCQNVELLSFLPPSATGGEGLYDIWGWTDSTTGREFAILGGSTGVAFVETTDPINPKYLGRLPFHGGVEGEAGIKVYKHHAFIVAEQANNGMQIFDLTQLRDVKTAPMEFRETAHYDGFGATHTLAMNEASGYAYPAGGAACGGGLNMIDVRTPTKPAFAGCYEDSHYIHDSQCVVYRGPDKQYQGREICLSAAIGAASLVLVDVTDKQHPKTISTVTYPNAALVHQGWLTQDQRSFFLDDELDEIIGTVKTTRTIVFDLGDLDDPVVLTEFYGTVNATDHNLYINGRYMYQSNYAAGLRIIDVGDPKQPKEVGYLDTTPADGPGMIMGSWGNYPFFKNGVVAVASNGLFLVRLLSQ